MRLCHYFPASALPSQKVIKTRHKNMHRLEKTHQTTTLSTAAFVSVSADLALTRAIIEDGFLAVSQGHFAHLTVGARANAEDDREWNAKKRRRESMIREIRIHRVDMN